MIDFAHGISTIDTDFQRAQFDASHLVVERGRAAFVDVGTNHSIPRLLAALAEKGLAVEQVDFVILTHVHLDHAGGAGLLMQQLPNARLIVHPRGLRHMVDPTQLIAGATAVYGAEEIERSYGTLQPVPAERIDSAQDGHIVDLAGRPLLCLDTPGHARHHISIFDARSAAFFPGDTFGLSYREFDSARGPFILPTTTPVQFEPEALRDSIKRMLAFSPQQMFLTHYSRVTDLERLADDLIVQIDAMVEIALDVRDADDRHRKITAALGALYISRALEHRSELEESRMRQLLHMDIELNAQGLGVWLDRQRE